MNVYYESLKRLYDSSRLTDAKLRNAVVKGLINQEEYKNITGNDY